MPNVSAPRALVRFTAPALAAALALTACKDGPTTQEITASLRSRFSSHRAQLAAHADPATGWAWAWYDHRGFAPAWLENGRPTRRAAQLVGFLAHAPSQGLPAAPYGAAALAAGLHRADDEALGPSAAADLDFALTRAYFRYARDLARGRTEPRALGIDWYADRRDVDAAAQLDRVVAASDAEAALAALAPPQDGYARLREARARYAAIARSGGWPQLPPGGELAPGARGAAVAVLRERLAREGDLAAAARKGDLYDAAVTDAVRRFQLRHGLEPSGAVDAATRAELDVPAAARLAAIDLNLERWRWLPDQFGERYLMVNIPEFALHAIEHGRSVLDMRVIVGKPDSRTPVFSDTMTYVEFHPFWNVPPSIVRSEILPAVRKDPAYLEEHGFEVVASWRDDTPIDPWSVDWDHASPSSLRIRQTPGGENALGRIKFVFPNRLNIYFHDTPADHLFARSERDFSHGCVRLSEPERLAAYVLRGSRWDETTIRASLDAGEHRDVTLPEKLPVHIQYWTAWVDDAGTVQFRPDVYGWDEELAQALRDASGSTPPVGDRS